MRIIERDLSRQIKRNVSMIIKKKSNKKHDLTQKKKTKQKKKKTKTKTIHNLNQAIDFEHFAQP